MKVERGKDIFSVIHLQVSWDLGLHQLLVTAAAGNNSAP